MNNSIPKEWIPNPYNPKRFVRKSDFRIFQKDIQVYYFPVIYVDKFTVTGVNYGFANTLLLYGSHCPNGDIQYSSTNSFSRSIKGTGKTLRLAEQDWKFQFHKLYQQYRGLMDYELNDEEKRLRESFEEYITPREYHELNPLKLIENGRVFRKSTEEIIVEWANTSQEHLDSANLLSNLSFLLPGDWFEATVTRDYFTGHILKIENVQKTECLDDVSLDGLDHLFEL